MSPSTTPAARSLQNALNRIAHEALRFGTLYQEQKYNPIRKNRLFLNVIRTTEPAPAPLVPRPTRELDPALASLRELNRLAHVFQDKQHQFEIYPDYRRPVQSVNARRPSVPSSTTSDRLELERLATLVSLLPSHVSPVTCELPKLLSSRDHTCTRFIRRQLRLDSSSKFSDAFPKTKLVTPVWRSGLPLVEKSFFNHLLASKLSELRSRYHLASTPHGFAPLVTSWLNSMLSAFTQSQYATKSAKGSSRLQQQKTPAPTRPHLLFVPADPSTTTSAPSPSKEVNNTDEKVALVQSTQPLTADSSPLTTGTSSLDLREARSQLRHLRFHFINSRFPKPQADRTVEYTTHPCMKPVPMDKILELPKFFDAPTGSILASSLSTVCILPEYVQTSKSRVDSPNPDYLPSYDLVLDALALVLQF